MTLDRLASFLELRKPTLILLLIFAAVWFGAPSIHDFIEGVFHGFKP
jgi:hypothetical protein